MEGQIHNFRQAQHHQKPNHLIILVDGVDSREKAQKLVGKKVTWTTKTGKTIEGEIRAPHGNKGAVRAIFERGLPGQALTTKVNIGA